MTKKALPVVATGAVSPCYPTPCAPRHSSSYEFGAAGSAAATSNAQSIRNLSFGFNSSFVIRTSSFPRVRFLRSLDVEYCTFAAGAIRKAIVRTTRSVVLLSILSLLLPDVRAGQLVVENLNVRGEGVFKRQPTPERTSQSTAPASADNFAGLIDIGAGRKMYLEYRGSGSPTVILESGYRNDADIWSAQLEPGMSTVLSQVAKFTRVCAYDRPGTFLDADHLGRSAPVPMPRTARDLVSDLHALLQTAHVPGPYVFAAHSFGGIFARLYASTYPNEVVGMVLIDALSEKVRTGLTPEQWKLYVNFGFTKPTPSLEKYKDIETLDVNASLDQMEKAATAEPLRPMPLFVLTQGQPFDLSPWQPLPADFPGALDKAWHAAQDALATLAPNAKHKIATRSSHYIQVQEPQLVIDAIKQVVEAVRNPATWTAAPTRN
jgi:pimeloyl-ACP methyl ester carboxylesterase